MSIRQGGFHLVLLVQMINLPMYFHNFRSQLFKYGRPKRLENEYRWKQTFVKAEKKVTFQSETAKTALDIIAKEMHSLHKLVAG